jgi:hypothetical protein
MDTQTAYRLSLVDDAIAANQAPEDAEHLARLVAYKEKLMNEVRISPTGVNYEDGTTVEFNGDGSGHSRKTEKPASEAQVRFIRNLLNDRVLPDNFDLHRPQLDALEAETLSKRSASDLIEWLTSLPVKAEKKNTASEKQVTLIEKLIGQLNDDTRPAMQKLYEGIVEAGELTGKAASGMIDGLIQQVNSQPKSETPAEEELESGMYRKGDKIYKVYRAVHGSGRMCAKELVKLDEPVMKRGKEHLYGFEYRGLAKRYVSAEDRMTLEEAKAFGAIYGVCCCCGATLTNEDSIDAGIGPICARKF